MTENQTAERNGILLQCPKCSVALKVGIQETVEVDYCGTCSGVWVDFIEEKKVLQIKPEAFTMDEIRRLRKSYQPIYKNEPLRYIPCPVCQELMHRRNWGSHSGIIVDRCGAHGTWYDEGEVEKVRDFIALGGIDYEKMRASEKGITRLESKVTAEVLRLDKRVDSAYRRARFWSLIGL